MNYEEVKKALAEAIKVNAEKASKDGVKPHEAQQFAQAACNAANTLSIIHNSC